MIEIKNANSVCLFYLRYSFYLLSFTFVGLVKNFTKILLQWIHRR